MIARGRKKTAEIMGAAGVEEVVQEARYAHLVGACRMGADPRSAVVDTFGQSHDSATLFRCDGSIFPTQGSAHPGLTVQTLAARTARPDLSPQGTAGRAPQDPSRQLFPDRAWR